MKELSNLSKTMPSYIKQPSSVLFYCIVNNLKVKKICRYTPREDFSVLISFTLVHAFILFFVLPFDHYHTAFLTLSLIFVQLHNWRLRFFKFHLIRLWTCNDTKRHFFNSLMRFSRNYFRTVKFTFYAIQIWKRQEQKYKLKTKVKKDHFQWLTTHKNTPLI